MSRIIGLEGMTKETLAWELQQGARFVAFQYVISVLVITFRRTSSIYYIPPGTSPLAKGWPFILLTLAVGWLGFPWGCIYTPMAIAKNLSGGIDVTAEVAAELLETDSQAAPALALDMVVSKRQYDMPDRTVYLVTFQHQNSAVVEMDVTAEWFQYLTPGDMGELTVQEGRFWNFQKVS